MPRSREELVAELRDLATEYCEPALTEAADLLDSLEGDDVITVYRRMKAAAEGARAERDIMREAVEGVAGFSVEMLERASEPTAVEMTRIAQAALDADEVRGIFKPPVGWHLIHDPHVAKTVVNVCVESDPFCHRFGHVVVIGDEDFVLAGETFRNRVDWADVRGAWLQVNAPNACPHCSKPPAPCSDPPTKGADDDGSRTQPTVPGVAQSSSSGQEGALQIVVDFLGDWRFCPVSTSSAPARSCLEDAAAQLLAALADCSTQPPVPVPSGASGDWPEELTVYKRKGFAGKPTLDRPGTGAAFDFFAFESCRYVPAESGDLQPLLQAVQRVCDVKGTSIPIEEVEAPEAALARFGGSAESEGQR
jgi:hypothetical protein